MPRKLRKRECTRIVRLVLTHFNRVEDLTEELGIDRTTPYGWLMIPLHHLEKISELTGLHPAMLRPDLAAMFETNIAKKESGE